MFAAMDDLKQVLALIIYIAFLWYLSCLLRVVHRCLLLVDGCMLVSSIFFCVFLYTIFVDVFLTPLFSIQTI